MTCDSRCDTSSFCLRPVSSDCCTVAFDTSHLALASGSEVRDDSWLLRFRI